MAVMPIVSNICEHLCDSTLGDDIGKTVFLELLNSCDLLAREFPHMIDQLFETGRLVFMRFLRGLHSRMLVDEEFMSVPVLFSFSWLDLFFDDDRLSCDAVVFCVGWTRDLSLCTCVFLRVHSLRIFWA